MKKSEVDRLVDMLKARPSEFYKKFLVAGKIAGVKYVDFTLDGKHMYCNNVDFPSEEMFERFSSDRILCACVEDGVVVLWLLHVGEGIDRAITVYKNEG